MANRALLVAIQHWKNFPGSPLVNTINDITAVAAYLKVHASFSENDIVALVGEGATKAGVEHGIENLVSGVTPDDRLVLCFSGHGTTMTVEGPDGKEIVVDAIAPWDFNFTAETALTTFDFQRLFDPLPDGLPLAFLSDSCHSGGLRDFEKHAEKFIAPPDYVQDRIDACLAAGQRVLRFREMEKPFCGTFLSGCRSDQTSADGGFPGWQNGAMTAAFLRAMTSTDAAVTPMTTIQTRMLADLKAHGMEQEPQLHGARIGKPFLAVGP